MPAFTNIVLIALVLIAAWSDIRTRRIPNSITVSGAVAGLVLNSFYGGIHGTVQSLAGAALGVTIFLALYSTGGMGAGDVKLFGAVGALVGPQALILVFVFTGLVGGIAALGLSLFRRRLRQTLNQTGELLLDLGRLRWQDARRASAAPDSLRLPYGIVIAGGTLVSLVVLH